MTTFSEWLDERATRWGDKTAIREESVEIGFKSLKEGADKISSSLTYSGLKKGTRAAIACESGIEFWKVFFGVLFAGGVVVPLNTQASERELKLLLQDCEPSFLVHDAAFSDKARHLHSLLPQIILISTHGEMSGNSTIRPTSEDSSTACIFYTSGTTGEPLGVMLSHRNLLCNAGAVAEALGLTATDRGFCVLPFHYIYGVSVALSHFSCGAGIVVEKQFPYPSLMLDHLGASRSTGFYGVSSHYAILCERTDFYNRVFPHLRYFAQAGDAMPPTLTHKILDVFPEKKLYLMYGQTEAAPRLSVLDPVKTRNKPTSVGRAVPGVEIKISEEGEILARGDTIMVGYWRRPNDSLEALKGGWLHTGDLGRTDEEGDLYILGRKSALLKVNGQKVNPTEIEALIKSRPAVREAAVIGLQHPDRGQQLKLFVTADPSETPDVLKSYLKLNLPSFKVPDEIVIVDTLPITGLGKIDKHALEKRTSLP